MGQPTGPWDASRLGLGGGDGFGDRGVGAGVGAVGRRLSDQIGSAVSAGIVETGAVIHHAGHIDGDGSYTTPAESSLTQGTWLALVSCQAVGVFDFPSPTDPPTTVSWYMRLDPGSGLFSPQPDIKALSIQETGAGTIYFSLALSAVVDPSDGGSASASFTGPEAVVDWSADTTISFVFVKVGTAQFA